MSLYRNYGLDNTPSFNGSLFTPEEQLEMERKRLRPIAEAIPEEELYGTDLSVPDLDTLLAEAAASSAPTGINPSAPASSQPPAIAPTVISTAVPNKYERKEGVTLNDRLQSLAITMSAVGTPQFASAYAEANQMLALKQQEADVYNMKLDEGTNPTVELSGGNLITRKAKYIRNADGTYSINPDAGAIVETKRVGTNGSSGQAYNTYLLMKDNGDIDADMTWDEFQASSAFDPFRTDYMRKVNNTESYLKSIGIDDRNLASQMAAGSLKITDMQGGGIKVFDSAGNLVKEITSPKEAQGFKQAYENAGSFGSKSGEAAVTDLQGFETDFAEIADGFSETQASIARGREAMSMLEEGEVDSGFVQGAIAKTFGIGDRQMGKLQGLSGQELINALSQTTLVPVSDTDIKKLELMFANISQDPEFAMGILDSFLAERERNLVISRDKFRRRIDRLRENPNIRNTTREADSFIKSYDSIYNFKTAAELLADEEIPDD